jgi:hypothetical protein
MTKYVVPEEGLKAAVAAAWKHIGFMSPQASPRIQKDIEDGYRAGLEAFVRWQSDNPRVPTDSDVLEILQKRVESGHLSNEEYCAIPATTVRCAIRSWLQSMYLAPEPEVPEEIKDLLVNGFVQSGKCAYNNAIIEATLRDQFAMAALTGLLSDPTSSGPEGCANAAYLYADKMMERR